MFQINIVVKKRGWFWNRQIYNVYRVVKVTPSVDCGDYYFPEEYETISEHLNLKDADEMLKQLIKYDVN